RRRRGQSLPVRTTAAGSHQARAVELIRSAGPADLDATHQAAKRPGVAQRDVLGAAIVPEGDRSLLPAEAEGEFRPVAVLEQEIEQRLALGRGHALDAD